MRHLVEQSPTRKRSLPSALHAQSSRTARRAKVNACRAPGIRRHPSGPGPGEGGVGPQRADEVAQCRHTGPPPRASRVRVLGACRIVGGCSPWRGHCSVPVADPTVHRSASTPNSSGLRGLRRSASARGDSWRCRSSAARCTARCPATATALALSRWTATSNRSANPARSSSPRSSSGPRSNAKRRPQTRTSSRRYASAAAPPWGCCAVFTPGLVVASFVAGWSWWG